MTRTKNDQLSLLATTATTTTLMFLSALPHAPILIWNGTSSAPVGLYLTVPSDSIRRGDLVLAKPPVTIQKLAETRGYVGRDVPLIKHVAALENDVVCAGPTQVTINGQISVFRLQMDSKGRPLDGWLGCKRLGSDDIFLLNRDVPASFDSRYFGPVSRRSIVADLRPFWTR
jgi:conjugative transfer signal peptidase TraF